MEKPDVLSEEDVIIPPKSKRRLRVFTEPLVKERIHQARQDTAREIFEEIVANWEIYREEDELPKFRYDYGKYQSLKSKITRKLTIARVV